MMFKPTHKKKSSINIIPMIDVIFFLLVFFMLFTSFSSNPYGIEMQLPKAVTVQEQENDNFVIEINEKGNFFYDEEKMSLVNITDIAENKFRDNKDLVVVINADRAVKYEHIVSVMDSLRQVGIFNLALAAEKDDNNKI